MKFQSQEYDVGNYVADVLFHSDDDELKRDLIAQMGLPDNLTRLFLIAIDKRELHHLQGEDNGTRLSPST